METKVLTPKGFKLIGDIKVGDAVCNPDGTTAKVIRVTDNGPKQFFRVTLADGSSVEADEDHLWAVSIAGARKRRKQDVPIIPAGLRPEDEWNLRVQTRCRVVNTLELRELVLSAADEKARGLRPHYVQIPLANPISMTGAKGRGERFTPYILGALIGDGTVSARSITICGIDEPIFERVRAELPAHLQLVRQPSEKRCATYSISVRKDGSRSDLLKEFSAEIRAWRVKRGWKQADFIRHSGFSASYVSVIERSMKWPSEEYARRADELLEAGGAILAAFSQNPGDSARTILERDGVYGCRAWDKFIPDRIKKAPVEDRFAFMQGLMDTDGHMDERGHVELVTVSERLANDARDVLHSLGYRATLTTKRPTYTYNGEKREGRLAYRLYIRGRHMDRLFHMPRKRERVAQFNGGDVEPWHRIVSVEPTEIDNSRCITVDNLNHLYVTDDYIVTHNSRALTAHAIRECVRYPGLRVGAFRRSYPELKESLIAELANLNYAAALGASWNGTEYELRFPNGSLIMFRYAESVKDASRRQGGQYQLLIFDERTLTPPDVVSFLESRLRSGRADIPVLGIRSSTNPGGPGHGAVKARFIQPTNYGERVVTDDRGRSVRFIPSKLSDNPHVNPEYAADLQALPDKLRAAFLDGDWDVFAGMMFPELKRERHVVEPITLPDTWRRYNGIDWGYTAPWAVLWAAVDEDGRVWVYRELYQRQVGEADQARRILAAETDDEQVAARYADDAMWATRGDAKPIASVYADNGVHLTPAGKGAGSRVTGWQRVRSYLGEGPACPHHRAQGWETCPKLHIFSTVTELYRELSDLPHATKGDPEDADTTADDHASDGLRYLLTNLGTGPQFLILDEPEKKLDVELLAALGPTVAYRPHDQQPPDPWADEDEPRRGTTARSPFV